MGHATPERGSASVLASPKRAAATLLESISTLLALCAKQASRASKRLETKMNSKRLPEVRPRQLLKRISNKAITLIQRNKHGGKIGRRDEEAEWGDGGVWQKAILMGGKCEPLDFSGVIYYDSNGKQLNEVPLRSPRASPLPAFLTSQSNQVY